MCSVCGNTTLLVLSSLIRISADLKMFAPPRSFSQLATSFFGAIYQGILREPFVAWSLYFSRLLVSSSSKILRLTRLIVHNSFSKSVQNRTFRILRINQLVPTYSTFHEINRLVSFSLPYFSRFFTFFTMQLSILGFPSTEGLFIVKKQAVLQDSLLMITFPVKIVKRFYQTFLSFFGKFQGKFCLYIIYVCARKNATRYWNKARKLSGQCAIFMRNAL